LAFTYILSSKTLNRFYTGACHLDELDGRIEKHNRAEYGTHRFTASASDWEVFVSFKCVNYPLAAHSERKIKSMKSSKYILKLKKYPELRDKILKETQST
jgi:putative endonuclease